jgi:hypothetical protein
MNWDVFRKDFVLIDMSEVPQDLESLRNWKPQGMPAMAILDSDGKLLITSDGPSGNIGYPLEPHEITHFMEMLKASTRRITEAERATLRAKLERFAVKYKSDQGRH